MIIYVQKIKQIYLIYSTGQLLATLKRLMSNLRNIQTLRLYDLFLERYEAKHLLDEIVYANCMELKILYLVNVTSTHCPIMHVGLFLNLHILVITPQNLDDDVLTLLADSKIRHLHILQNRYTPSGIVTSPCTVKGWRLVKRDNPHLYVHLRIESTSDGEILIQPEAPVRSIIYQAPKAKVRNVIIYLLQFYAQKYYIILTYV